MLVGRGADNTPETLYGAMSNSAGHFSITRIPPRDYSIMLERRGFVLATGIKKGVVGNGVVNLKPGEQNRDLVLEMVPRSIISGRVLDEYGEPLMGATVEVLPLMFEPVVRFSPQVLTNDRGEFRIGVAPGKYRIKAGPSNSGEPSEVRRDEAEGGQYSGTYYPGVLEMASANVIDAKPGSEVSGIEIRLVRSRTFSIAGTITGIPKDARDVGVTIETAQNSAIGITSSHGWFDRPDNQFSFDHLTSGTYHIYAHARAGEEELQSPVRELTVTDSDIEGISLPLQSGFELMGKIETSRKVTEDQDLIVTLHSAGSGPPRYHRADIGPDGSFKIKNVFAERYQVEVEPLAENSFIKSVTVNGAPVADGILDFSSGAPTGKLKITLSSNGAQVTGKVQYGKEGVLAPFATVLLFPDRESIASNDYRFDRVDANGGYSFKGLAAGRYRLMAVASSISEHSEIMAAIEKERASAEVIEIKEGEKIVKDVKLDLIEEADARQE